MTVSLISAQARRHRSIHTGLVDGLKMNQISGGVYSRLSPTYTKREAVCSNIVLVHYSYHVTVDTVAHLPQSWCHVFTATFSYVAEHGRTWLQREQTWNSVAKTW